MTQRAVGDIRDSQLLGGVDQSVGLVESLKG